MWLMIMYLWLMMNNWKYFFLGFLGNDFKIQLFEIEFMKVIYLLYYFISVGKIFE